MPKTDLEIATELKRRSELPCTCDRDDYDYICLSCNAKSVIEETQFEAECTITEPNGTVTTCWKHDSMFVGPKRETIVTTKEIPTQSTVEFDFLDNLWQDIIDAVCTALDSAELTTHVVKHSVSNIVIDNRPCLINPYRILGIRLPEYILFDLSLRSSFEGFIA